MKREKEVGNKQFFEKFKEINSKNFEELETLKREIEEFQYRTFKDQKQKVTAYVCLKD